MMTIEELREALEKRLKETGESGNAFAKRLGIQQSSISKLLNNRTGIAFESAMKILDELGYSLFIPSETQIENGNAITELQGKVEHLTNVRDALKCANRAQEKIISLLEEKLEAKRRLEKKEAPQTQEHPQRPASASNPRVDTQS